MADLTGYESLVELAALIRGRELSPVDLLDFCLRRIGERNPSLNAVISLYADEARERARAATEAISSGESWGPLHGVPTLIKDGFGQKPGWVSTYGGIGRLESIRDAAYCPFAERVEKAGAIIVGKTNAPTMGFRGTTDNFLFGPTRNPFDLDRNSGGSSGGSAAAVADGIVAFAEGTDGGGSIRIPAAWCGVVGFKPSWGRVPSRRRPDAFNTTLFAAEGPLTRSVADAALVSEVISGPDPLDPHCQVDRLDLGPALEAGIAGLRVAFSPDLDVFPVETAVAGVVEAAVRDLGAAGAAVDEVEVRLPFDPSELSDAWCRMIWLLNLDTLDVLRSRGVDVLADARDALPAQCLEWADRARRLHVADLQRDRLIRTAVFDVLQSVLQDHDVLVTPTLSCPPVLNRTDGNTVGPSRIGDVAVDPLIGWCLTYPVNFTGHPAISVPAGLTRSGLPVGLQIIGRRLDDRTVIAAAAALERVRPWFAAYERCAGRSLTLPPPATSG